MTPEEKKKLNKYIKGISEILVNNTPQQSLNDLESIELAVREQMLSSISPVIGNFFVQRPQEQPQDAQDKGTAF